MIQRRHIGSVFIISLIAASSQAATVTVQGIPFFDTSLGILNRATVTIDPAPHETSIQDRLFFPSQQLGDHQHDVTFPSFQFLGRDIVFQPVTTTAITWGEGSNHTHMFDAPPALPQAFEGADLDFFMPSPGIRGTVFLLQGLPTSEALGHSHVSATGIDLSREASTTFEFTPVPEPSSVLILAALVAWVFSRRPLRF